MSHLAIEVEGDASDQRDAERRSRKNFTKKDASGVLDEKYCALSHEKVLDWRNRTQRRRLARSVVGTSQYMAPEVIRGEMYDGRCD